ncbi:hypothetical protein [Actinoplanes sp. NPDC026619]|uniref:hypothetical protein n=1 Tax=Actinoplanes sp. NPDC026619 TaxID=3155798 RepID=UPI003408A308
MGFLLFVGGVALIVWAIVESSRKKNPAAVGTELAAALSRGDGDKSRKALSQLPGWKIVERLRTVADGTCELRRDAMLASQAGVPADTLTRLYTAIGRNEEIVVAVARKVAALGEQSGGRFRKLPPAARQLLDQDVARLDEISRASRTVRSSLQVATASLHAGAGAARADALEAVGRALYELSTS